MIQSLYTNALENGIKQQFSIGMTRYRNGHSQGSEPFGHVCVWLGPLTRNVLPAQRVWAYEHQSYMQFSNFCPILIIDFKGEVIYPFLLGEDYLSILPKRVFCLGMHNFCPILWQFGYIVKQSLSKKRQYFGGLGCENPTHFKTVLSDVIDFSFSNFFMKEQVQTIIFRFSDSNPLK